MFIRWFSLYSVCCAQQTITSSRTAATLKINRYCRILVRIGCPSEGEVKAQENAAIGQLREGDGRRSLLLCQGILRVISETCPAEHERVIAESKGVRIEIPEIARSGGQCLLGHPHELIALDEDHLRIDHIVGLYESAIPRRRASSGGKGSVRWGAGSEGGTVPAMLIE